MAPFRLWSHTCTTRLLLTLLQAAWPMVVKNSDEHVFLSKETTRWQNQATATTPKGKDMACIVLHKALALNFTGLVWLIYINIFVLQSFMAWRVPSRLVQQNRAQLQAAGNSTLILSIPVRTVVFLNLNLSVTEW